MFTLHSTIKEVYEHPVGRDLLQMAYYQKGRGDRILRSKLLERMKLGTLQKLPFFRLDRGFVRSLIRLMNDHPNLGPGAPRSAGSWWEEAVFYRIFLRSFRDGDGDGIGDIQGVLENLGYLTGLGVDAVILGSALDSPGHNGGLDVRDFRALLGAKGEDEIRALVEGFHAASIKLIIELPANRTSREHPWYQPGENGRSGRTAGYYHFRKEPNNWTSMSGGSAFPVREEDGTWSLRLSSESEPELNWENPDVRREMADICRFWLDMGADGIYLAGAGLISKHEGLPYGSEGVYAITEHCGFEHYFFGPRLLDYLRELKKEVFEPKGALLIGDTPGMGERMCRVIADCKSGGLDVAVSNEPLRRSASRRRTGVKFDLLDYKKYIVRMMREYDRFSVTPLFFENDRTPRMLSRIEPPDRYADAAAKMLGTLMMTLKGMPIIYQGQELGMGERRLDSPEQLSSIQSRVRYDLLRGRLGAQKAQQRTFEEAPELAWAPIRWTQGKNGGFCAPDVAPWTRVHEDREQNVADEAQDPHSVLNFYRALIELRSSHAALRSGEIIFPPRDLKGALIYSRTDGEETFLICCNLTGDWIDRRGGWPDGTLILSNCSEPQPEGLLPYEADIWLCSGR